jgi:cytochrome P450
MAEQRRNVVKYDQHSPEYAADSVEINRKLRESSCPVAWSDAHGGFWVVSRHDHLSAVSRDNATFSSEHDLDGAGRGYQGVAIPAPPVHMIPLEIDPPAFFGYRRLMTPFLSPTAAKARVPFMRELANACINEFIERGEADLIEEVANPVPAILTLAILGLSLAEWRRFAEPMHTSVYAIPGTPEHTKAFMDQLWIVGQIRDAILERREAPRDDLLSKLATGKLGDGTPVSVEEAVKMAYTVMAGGIDTTTALLANAFVWLSDHPEERRKLVDNPRAMLQAREEFLRYFTPAQGFARTATRDTEIAGCPVKAGERVLMSYGSANRDDRVFDAPDELRLDRAPNPHVSFGIGLHRCLGANIARNEIDAVLNELLRRIPDYVVDHSGIQKYPSIGAINGLIRVPARFTPGRREGISLDELMRRGPGHFEPVDEE